MITRTQNLQMTVQMNRKAILKGKFNWAVIIILILQLSVRPCVRASVRIGHWKLFDPSQKTCILRISEL